MKNSTNHNHHFCLDNKGSAQVVKISWTDQTIDYLEDEILTVHHGTKLIESHKFLK